MTDTSRLRAIVTAGGTREPIDDVRVVTNLSRGRFGAAIARVLAARGVETTLVGAAELVRSGGDIDPRIRCVPFSSFADLARELDLLVAGTPPDLLFMAAAVSDFSPLPRDGKISSDAEELIVRMRRNPKLLSRLREQCGIGTFLVGFKLLSGAPPDALLAAALRQVRQDRLNLTVANDLSRLTEAEHPVLLVTPEGGAIPAAGPRDEVAARLVDFVLRRARTRWSRSCPDDTLPAEPDLGAARAERLLAFAQSAVLLPATDGNVSARADASGLWITPRQVEKAGLRQQDLIRAEVDFEPRRVRFRGVRKPSIDTAVHAWLYRHLPPLAALLHFHDALVLPDAETAFPYPCGTLEEAEEVHRALVLAARAGRWRGGSFALRLAHHGFLVGLDAGGPDRLAREWEAARAAHHAHLDAIGEAVGVPLVVSPVFASSRIVGVHARHAEQGWSTVFLLPSQRGHGVGERLLELLEDRGATIAAHDACRVLPFYLARGWRSLRRQGPVVLLESPTRRDDLQSAASACLLDPLRGQVLLARRLTEPWKDHWTFPGGRAHPGEDLRTAAARELREETGIELPDPEPAARKTAFVGIDAGRSAFAVTCHVHLLLDRPDPRTTGEVEAEWLTIEDALRRTPLAPGTRRVLLSLPELTAPADAQRPV